MTNIEYRNYLITKSKHNKNPYVACENVDLSLIPVDLMNDKKFMMNVISNSSEIGNNPYIYVYLNKELKKDIDILKIITKTPYAEYDNKDNKIKKRNVYGISNILKYIPEEVMAEECVVKRIIKDKYQYKELPDVLKSNIDICVDYTTELYTVDYSKDKYIHSERLYEIPKEVLNNDDFIFKYIEKIQVMQSIREKIYLENRSEVFKKLISHKNEKIMINIMNHFQYDYKRYIENYEKATKRLKYINDELISNPEDEADINKEIKKLNERLEIYIKMITFFNQEFNDKDLYKNIIDKNNENICETKAINYINKFLSLYNKDFLNDENIWINTTNESGYRYLKENNSNIINDKKIIYKYIKLNPNNIKIINKDDINKELIIYGSKYLSNIKNKPYLSGIYEYIKDDRELILTICLNNLESFKYSEQYRSEFKFCYEILKKDINQYYSLNDNIRLLGSKDEILPIIEKKILYEDLMVETQTNNLNTKKIKI